MGFGPRVVRCQRYVNAHMARGTPAQAATPAKMKTVHSSFFAGNLESAEHVESLEKVLHCSALLRWALLL